MLQVAYYIVEGNDLKVVFNRNESQTLYSDETWTVPVLFFTSSDRTNLDEQFYMNLHVYNQFNDEGVLLKASSEKYETRLKYRGSSSLEYPKKQYRLTFVKEGKNSLEPIGLLGMEADAKWVLNGPYLDYSFMRNDLMYRISRQVFDWSPSTKYCEVFMDGEYKGVYLLIESVEANENRLDLNKFGLLNGQIPFIIKRDRINDEEEIIKTYGSTYNHTVNNLLLVEPSADEISEIHRNWIIDYIDRFEKKLYNEDFDHELLGYNQFIDVDNFIDYYVLNLFSANKDAGDLSTYIYRDLDSKIKLVPWDFNSAFGLYIEKSPYSIDDEIYNWFSRLLEDEHFRKKVVKRYHELRLDLLSYDSIESMIDSNLETYEAAFLRDVKEWHYKDESIQINVSDLTDEFYMTYYKASIADLKVFIQLRGEYLDENIETLLEEQFSKN